MIRKAFTLIELLVVITVIVVLLALLTPALDKAIYQAELAVCAAHLDGVATGAMTYATAHRRHYPHRPGVIKDGWQAMRLNDPRAGYDDRVTIRDYVNFKLLQCALTGEIDLDPAVTDADAWAMSPYHLFFGFRYNGYGSGMMRIGDRLGWKDDKTDAANPRLHRFNLLASDRDVIWPTAPEIHGSHPDDAGKLENIVFQNEHWNPFVTAVATAFGGGKWVLSWWYTAQHFERGLVDLQFAYQDGSVERFLDVEMADQRMAKAGESANWADRWNAGQYTQLPAD